MLEEQKNKMQLSYAHGSAVILLLRAARLGEEAFPQKNIRMHFHLQQTVMKHFRRHWFAVIMTTWLKNTYYPPS